MRTLVAIILGIMGGFLIYMELALLFVNKYVDTNQTNNNSEIYLTIFVLVTFFGGWVLTSYLMLKGTKTVTKVFSRGFLIGAALWLALIPVGFIYSSNIIGESPSNAGVIGAGIVGFLTGGVAIGMALACLIGFAVSYSLGREMKPEVSEDRIKCPSCA